MMRHWITVCEMTTLITQSYIDAAYEALNQAGVPSEIIVDLSDMPEDVMGFSSDLPNLVELSYIAVPERIQGQGQGSKVLRVLTTLADKMGVTLVLTASENVDDEDWPMSSAELSYWYERYGFQGDRKMYRLPQKPAEAG